MPLPSVSTRSERSTTPSQAAAAELGRRGSDSSNRDEFKLAVEVQGLAGTAIPNGEPDPRYPRPQ